MFEITKFKLIVGVIVLFLLIGGALGYLFFTKSKSPTATANPDEVTKLIEELSRIYDLPTGEAPTVATVTDVDKLKDQPFFAKAKNGDKVIIYNQAKKAILYDPISRRILEVAPIDNSFDISQESTPAAQTESSPKPQVKEESKEELTAKIALRNGAGRRGLAATTEEELKKTYPDINIIAKDNVDTQNLDKTIVVVISGAFNSSAVIKKGTEKDAEKLAKFFNAQISALPKGETIPEGTEIMVILGKDRI